MKEYTIIKSDSNQEPEIYQKSGRSVGEIKLGDFFLAVEKLHRMGIKLQRNYNNVDKLYLENKRLQNALNIEKLMNKELETRLNAMKHLTDGVAKKSSQEEVIKAIRTFVNNSKRKKIDKRAAAKEMVLEFITTNRIDVPQDLMDVILSLDDEQPEVKVVNVSGNYNDVHDNGKVNIKKEEGE